MCSALANSRHRAHLLHIAIVQFSFSCTIIEMDRTARDVCTQVVVLYFLWPIHLSIIHVEGPPRRFLTLSLFTAEKRRRGRSRSRIYGRYQSETAIDVCGGGVHMCAHVHVHTHAVASMGQTQSSDTTTRVMRCDISQSQ